MPDRSVIEALQSALAAEPNNVAVLAHLSSLLLQDGDNSSAFDYARRGLAVAPDHLELLRTAVSAGGAEGADVSGYRRVLAALQGSDGEPYHASEPDSGPTDPNASPVSLSDGGDRPQRIPDSADELLEAWAIDGDAPSEDPLVGELQRPSVRLADVAGLVDVKQRVERSFLAPIRNPELLAAFGKRVGGGLLLWGPPGCGKTFLARALAGELGANFYEVALNDVLDMWIGSSERNLHGVFEVARRNAPCVIFFDEVDAIGLQRTQLRNSSAMRGVVNQLLNELDGATHGNDGVFILGATNHPWDLDAALLRPGRFDRTLLVLPPDAAARAAIFEVHLRGRPTLGVNVGRLASVTDGLSGADIRLVCEEATESAMALSIERGAAEPITQSMLEAAVRTVPSSIGPWMETARNYATYANEGGRYDELREVLKRWRG